MASKKPNHVVVMAFPYGTHAMPLFNLVRRLAIQAPTLTFSFFSTSKSNQSVFGTSSNDNIPSNIKSYDVDDGVPKDFTGHHMAEMIFFLKSMVENYKNGIHSVYGDEMKMIKCFICDSFMYFGSDMADELGVPMVSFWTAGPCSLSTHFYTDLIRQSITLGPNGREEEIIDFVPGLSLIRIRDLQEDKQSPNSVAYISFGTLTTPPPHELAALAEGLEESGVPFLWSLKDHLVCQLPNGFLERTSKTGFIVPWTPQQRVLGHHAVGVFVTHCGWNSVMESITAGVPMICRPFFGDQRINCRMVSDVWGIGTRIKDGVFTKDGTKDCLDMILYEEKFRERIGALRSLAKHAVGLEGSSTKNFNTLAEIVCKD
ncbi:hypothetical protein C5167_005187 [Papaver somniferum]|uniref:Uncharacterized protein n=1 Tax=Papaver somniferum TaxID=3469 RepID=A0A4Y7JCY5_PAPSO|nr:hypothetical protein C5167_005187 [Papaver somniferum]